MTWELDLTEANKAKLAEALQPYLDKAHPAQVAQAARTRSRAPRGAVGGKRILTEEDYGFPRRGRASAEEADYVRNNLDEVNARLRAAGVREIDPTDQKVKDRYGLEDGSRVDARSPQRPRRKVSTGKPQGWHVRPVAVLHERGLIDTVAQ